MTNINLNSFWCANCGAHYTTITGTLNCRCRQRKVRWEDKQDNIIPLSEVE